MLNPSLQLWLFVKECLGDTASISYGIAIDPLLAADHRLNPLIYFFEGFLPFSLGILA
jgi:hypothetical protein